MEERVKMVKSQAPAVDRRFYEELIERSLRMATPFWPLQNSVAVNPFWFKRNEPFDQVLTELSPAIHHSLFMPVDFFLEKINSGTITESALEKALELLSRKNKGIPSTVVQFLSECRVPAPPHPELYVLSESLHVDARIHTAIIADVGKHCAAYLDERQAISPYPWKRLRFWNAWVSAQDFDSSIERIFPVDKKGVLTDLALLDPEDAVAFMLARIGLAPSLHTAYLRRLTATVLGWSSQFKYCEWQRSLGNDINPLAECKDLLAVRLAYDFLLARSLQESHPESLKQWTNQVADFPEDELRVDSPFPILQLAAELSYQTSVSQRIASLNQRRSDVPEAQFVFCIDVRSESYRRHLESRDPAFQTIGFAGFFGAPFDYKRVGEDRVGHRLPVLLAPAYHVSESSREKDGRVSARLLSEKVQSYFRRLRKNPISSFIYVELFGALYIQRLVSKTFHFFTDQLRRRRVPGRFQSEFGPDLDSMQSMDGTPITLDEKIDRAASVLTHLGLTRDFAELVWFVGHGSRSTNNAFASSLDCGACGGHAGDINARLIADLLNDPSVRAGLKIRGIQIPDGTWFIAAIHETVTDEVYALDSERIPDVHRKKSEAVEAQLRLASKSCFRERSERLPLSEHNSYRRGHNWSEVRPEWGLVGNASFIVAPRERTLRVDLESRAFLHDYDWKKDESSEFKTLELIMTAPMVVTNWINLQYYASTVAPQVYGAGNKILHNLTNECGVVEGNGGDLRFGLPIQSVHDGKRFMHEPLRLSVYIEAPREEIEKVIARHETVRELVDNGWLHILHIEPGESRISLRTEKGEYRPSLSS